MPNQIAGLAAQGIPEDPYAAIRRLRINRQTGRQQLIERGDGGSSVPEYESLPDQLMIADDTLANMGAFQSKYNGLTELPDGRVQMTVQRPGMHKYDTQELVYKIDPESGEYVLDDSVAPVDSRQTSSNNRIRDSLEHGVGFVGTGLAAAYGASLLGGLGAGAGATEAAMVNGIPQGLSGAEAAALFGGGEQFAGMTLAEAAAASGGAGLVNGIPAGMSGPDAAQIFGGGEEFAGMAPTGGGIAPPTTPTPPSTPSSPGVPNNPGAVTPTGPNIPTVPPSPGWTGSAGDWIQLAGLVGGAVTANNAQNGANSAAATAANEAAANRAFTERQYNDNLPYVRQAQERTLAISDAQLASMRQQDAQAAEYANYNRTTFRPLEQQIVASAQNYDTPEKRQAAADAALADVNSQGAAFQAARSRQLTSAGINPGSARSMAVMASGGIEAARAGVGAAAQARRGVETTGFARQMDAASLGRNLPSAQATSAGLGLQAGNSSANNAVSGANVSLPTSQLAQSGFNAASNLNVQAAGLQQRATDSANQLWGQLGQTAGRYITSDKNMKSDIKAADPDAALEQVTATPVSNYTYNPAKMAEAGIPMERPAGEVQTGPMAQDVKKTMGDKAAPGGKKINVGTMIGKAMLSIQALDKKVDKLASMLGNGHLKAGAA